VKNKRSKSSIFYNSTKNKRKKQEKNENLEEIYQKQEKTPQRNARSSYPGKQFSSRNPTAIAPFITSENNDFTRPSYTYRDTKATKTYLYDFTNSKFIYFLGSLDPKSYLLFVSLIALLITDELNRTEAKIIYAFISNISDTIQTIVEQEIILENHHQAIESREFKNALHHDLNTLYKELDKIKKKFPN